MSYVNGTRTTIETWVEKYQIQYLDVVHPFYMITASEVEFLMVITAGPILPINTSVFIGLISGSAIVLGLLLCLIISLIRNHKNHTLSYDDYEEDTFEMESSDGADWAAMGTWEDDQLESVRGYRYVEDPWLQESD